MDINHASGLSRFPSLIRQWWSRCVHPHATLGACLGRRDDNFLLLRFVAAVMVIFGHSYALCGIPGARDFIARAELGEKIYSGSLAVDIFFTVSGLLITMSYLRRHSLDQFLRARFLRIFPAFAACIVLSACVLGPALTTLPIGAYFSHPNTQSYLLNNLRFGPELQWGLPGVFATNPYANVVNGSIWSLPGEVYMYLWVVALGLAGVLERRWLAHIAMLGILVLGFVAPTKIPMLPGLVFLRPAAFFMCGAFCFINRNLIPLRTSILAGLVITATVAKGTAVFPFVFFVCVVYACLWFAYRPKLAFFNKVGDYSYGLYLWGFPMQQWVAHGFGRPTPALTNFAMALPLTLICAIGSWHLLEKPILRFKTQKPRSATAVS
jgi:peptidoglycan/LPS O-acetylase OafA/YrhL